MVKNGKLKKVITIITAIVIKLKKLSLSVKSVKVREDFEDEKPGLSLPSCVR